MTTREERDRRRQERLAAEQRELAAARRRLVFGYVTAGALTLAVVVGLAIVLLSGGDSNGLDSEDVPEAAHVQLQTGSINDIPFDDRVGTTPPPLQQGDLETAAADGNCDLQLDLPDEGNTHIKPSDPVPDYKTNPPTSGNHIEPPLQQADGAYSKYPGAQYVVHSMEHGRIEIQYSPDLPEKDQLALKGVFDESPAGVLFFPNPDMPYEAAATAWTTDGGELLGCPKYEGRATLDAIRDFRDIYRGLGPEPASIVVPNG
jgi:Protein of unknown function (DUF3105)